MEGELSKRSLVDKRRPPSPAGHCSTKIQAIFREQFPGSRGSSPGLTVGTLLGDKEDTSSSNWTGDSFIYILQAGETASEICGLFQNN